MYFFRQITIIKIRRELKKRRSFIFIIECHTVKGGSVRKTVAILLLFRRNNKKY